MKKTVKTTKTLTPAKKTAKPAVRKTPAARAAKAVTPKAVVTTIIANFDVGFGRALYLRGEGLGLSWDHGLLMECVAPDQWKAMLSGETVRPLLFKFLIDDSIWSAGSDLTATAGETVTVTPAF
jgi:hypothetical protein